MMSIRHIRIFVQMAITNVAIATWLDGKAAVGLSPAPCISAHRL